MIESICIILRRPQGEQASMHALRMAWATLMSEIETHLVLLDDGIYNLLGAECYNIKVIDNFINEGGRLYCAKESLEQRGVLEQDIDSLYLNIIPQEMLKEIVSNSQSVAIF